jgi:Domain of unknown function (DUF4864)
MIRFLLRFLPALLLIAALERPALAQQDTSSAAITDVIERQIAAFRVGDSDLAYSFASEGIHRMFPTPGIFMQMVEQGYEPVYRPRSYTFMDQQVTGDEAIQLLDVIGPDGSAWIAVYTLKHDPDGTWKITGCQLKPGVGA